MWKSKGKIDKMEEVKAPKESSWSLSGLWSGLTSAQSAIVGYASSPRETMKGAKEYLSNKISMIPKMTSFYWISAKESDIAKKPISEYMIQAEHLPGKALHIAKDYAVSAQKKGSEYWGSVKNSEYMPSKVSDALENSASYTYSLFGSYLPSDFGQGIVGKTSKNSGGEEEGSDA